MAQLEQIMRYFAVYLEGVGYLGEGAECELPNLEAKTEEFRGGGMDMPLEIDLGMKAMEAKFKLHTFDKMAYTRFSLLGPNKISRLTFRGSLEGYSGEIVGVQAKMDARIKKIENGNWKPGDKADLSITCAVDFYELIHGEVELVYIDPLNFIRRINGRDQLEAHRINLGIGTSNN
jgi:P2 family phage contractile tail tube protein